MADIRGESCVENYHADGSLRPVLLILMGTALAAEGVPNVVDQAGVLTKSQQSQLERALKNVNFTYDVRLAVYIVPSTHGMKIGDYADHVLDEQYGDGKTVIWSSW